MLVESVIRRTGGTRVRLHDVEYVFTPGADGRHLCEVENADHAQTLCAIPEGFRMADESTDPLLRVRFGDDPTMAAELMEWAKSHGLSDRRAVLDYAQHQGLSFGPRTKTGTILRQMMEIASS